MVQNDHLYIRLVFQRARHKNLMRGHRADWVCLWKLFLHFTPSRLHNPNDVFNSLCSCFGTVCTKLVNFVTFEKHLFIWCYLLLWANAVACPWAQKTPLALSRRMLVSCDQIFVILSLRFTMSDVYYDNVFALFQLVIARTILLMYLIMWHPSVTRNFSIA